MSTNQDITVNVLKFRSFSSFSNERLVFGARITKLLVKMTNREDPVRLLLYVCPVCLDLSGRHLVFKISVLIHLGFWVF